MNSNSASARPSRPAPSRWHASEELLPAPRGFRGSQVLDRNLARLAYAILFSEADDLDRAEPARTRLLRHTR